MSEFFDQAFDQFGFSSADPVRLDPGASQAWRDGTSLPDLSQAKSTISKAATKAGISGASQGGSTSTGQPAAALDASPNGIGSGSIGGWLVRIVVIVLGFVFVGVGLTMFRPNEILERVTR